jgi:hypothetical protein
MKTTFTFFALICSFIFHNILSAQSLKLNPTIRAEIFVATTSSFSMGNFISDHQIYSESTFKDATIKQNIWPLTFGTLGGQLRILANKEGTLSNFSISTGMYYTKRGFNQSYVFTSENNGTEKLKYTEKYTINNIVIPFLLRLGNKYFVELGPSYDYFLSATRKQKLSHSASGSGAYDGGYEVKDSETFDLNKTLFDKSSIGFTIGAGIAKSKWGAFRITNHYYKQTFATGNDFISYMIQAEIVFNLFKISFKNDK